MGARDGGSFAATVEGSEPGSTWVVDCSAGHASDAQA
jgi:hypothetical protein